MFHMDNLKIKRQNFLISTPGQFFEIKRQNSFIFTPGRIGVWQLHKQVAGPRHTLAHLKLFFSSCQIYLLGGQAFKVGSSPVPMTQSSQRLVMAYGLVYRPTEG